MLNKVSNYIKEKNLIDKKSKIVLAFSYGIDSRALLDILIKLGYEVILAHVNHGHRAESKIEEESAISLAKSLNLKIYVNHLVEDTTKNFHDDAHNKRYKFFMDVAKKEGTSIIATAHHKDDNAETIIGNIIAGSNLYGYSGIASSLLVDGFKIIRPLLCLSKADIKAYQEENKLEYFEDSSNSEDYYRRNRIRHNILPLMLNENPNLLDSISNYSEILLESFNFIRKQSISFLKGDYFSVEKYTKLDKAIRHDVISLLLERNEIERAFNLIKKIDEVLLGDRPQADISLKNGYLLKKRYDNVFLDTNRKQSEIEYELWENNEISIGNYHFYFTQNLPPKGVNYISLCYNQLVFPLKLRTRKDGDKIVMPFGTKKLKDLFIDLKLSNEKRASTLLLENNGEILWVLNYAKSKKLIEMKKTGNIYLVYEE